MINSILKISLIFHIYLNWLINGKGGKENESIEEIKKYKFKYWRFIQ